MNNEMFDKDLQLCACIGSLNGEPYCPCRMRKEGLETSGQWTQEDKDVMKQALAEIFKKSVN